MLYKTVVAEVKFKIGRHRIRKWLQSQEACSLTKGARRKFRISREIVEGIDSMWDVDLMDMVTLSKPNKNYKYILGPVVQSVVSLTSSLRVISLTVLADSIYNFLKFFALQKLLTFFFSKKFQHICVSLDVNFNESLTNDVVSFEQLGPGCH